MDEHKNKDIKKPRYLTPVLLTILIPYSNVIGVIQTPI
jgi:hypothetical protein